MVACVKLQHGRKGQFYVIIAVALLLLTYGLLSFLQVGVRFDLSTPIASKGMLLNFKITEDMEYLNRTHSVDELDFLVPWYFDSISKKMALKDMRVVWHYNSTSTPRYVVYEISSGKFYLKKRILFH